MSRCPQYPGHGACPQPCRGARRRAFTLTELLVVISIIILVLGMAIPLFKAMSADRSISSAQNMVSAMLQRARARAIGMQAPRGIFFYEDQATKRTAMVLVKITSPTATNPNANLINLDENAEEYQALPVGVGAAFALGANQTSSGSTAAVTTQSNYKPYGLIAFDEQGRLLTLPGYTMKAAPTAYPNDTALRQQYKDYIGNDVMDTLGAKATGPQEFSSSVVMLYDKVALAAQPPNPNDPTTFGPEQKAWLDNNAFAVSVNRYTGTILESK